MSGVDRVVVVGGGIGGVSVSAALCAGGHTGELVLLDRAAFPYDRPPLSKEYLAGKRDLAEIALQQPGWYADRRIELVGRAEVTAIAPADDDVTVELADGRRWVADRVVLATGGRACRPPVPGGDSPRVHVLRDADRLCAALRPGASLLVVGAGLIGAEVASTARTLGCRVTLVDPLDPPLAAAVGREVARWLHAQHAVHGVETVTTVLGALWDTPTGIAAQLRGETASREYDAVLLGVGMVPRTDLARDAGLEVDRGVLVDSAQVTSHPRVLAIGDCAQPRDRRRAEHWEAAQDDGRRAAATILGNPTPATTAPWWWSDRYDSHVEGVGELRAPGAEHAIVVRGRLGEAPYSVFCLRSEGGVAHVIGAVAVDDSAPVRTARRLIDRRIAVDPVRLADTATDLRKLLRA